MRNLGPSSMAMLSSAGLDSLEDLRELGPLVAFLAVRQCGHRPSLNLLWAIYGAIHDLSWTEVSPETKIRLLTELEHLTK